jgi:hypothetical protein
VVGVVAPMGIGPGRTIVPETWRFAGNAMLRVNETSRF